MQPNPTCEDRAVESPPRRALTPLAAEALLAFGLAALVASVLVVFGPPGSDLAAHVYQSGLFRDHGFQLWNNFWYEGRYSFVTYSLLYYPAASLLGIQLLAVLSIATAALAFTVIAAREWGPAARWSSRSFAVVWAGVVLSGAYPFALGATFALLALWALQSRAPPAVRRVDRPLLRSQPTCVRAARAGARGDRPRPPAGPGRAHPPRGDRGSSRDGLGRPLAALPGRRPLPLLDRGAGRGLRVLRSRHRLHVAGAGGARAPVAVRALSPGLRDRVSHSFQPGRERGATSFRCRSTRDPDALVAPVAAAPTRRGRLPAGALVERLTARSELREGLVRSGVSGGLLGARDRLPPQPPRPFVPGRSGGHDGSLGGRLPAGSRDPDHARLVPPGGLPPQRGAVRRRRARRACVDPLAATDGRSLRRAPGCPARLQLGGRGRHCCGAAAPGSGRCSARPTRPFTPCPRHGSSSPVQAAQMSSRSTTPA